MGEPRWSLSPSFRRAEREKLGDRGMPFKVFYFAWGLVERLGR